MNIDSRFAITAAVFLVLFSNSSNIAGRAQDATPSKSADHSELAAALAFEAEPKGNMPGGWGGGPQETIFVDEKVVHGGRWAARIERTPASTNNFTSVTKSIPVDFAGATIELRGFLRTEDVSDFSGLWMREDGVSPTLAFDNMQNRHLNGTTPWTEYSITLPIHSEANQLFFGVLQSGTGKTWADDLQLLVDGKPVWDAPKAERPKTVFDSDHEFDTGSRISIHELTQTQIENLATLGKVWGFLKYYHPSVISGQHHWDYELFRLLPAVLAAKDRADADAVLLLWVQSLGAVERCHGCTKLDTNDLHFGPDLDWISQPAALGSELSESLQSIRDGRRSEKQFYVSQVRGIGNPAFDHELAYANVKLPDSGFQLLGLFRFWNIVEYWSPYRDLLGTQWNSALTEFIPRFALTKDADSYKREVLTLLTKFGDGHANLWGSLDVRPPVGKCEIPVDVRFVQNAPVIVGLRSGAPSDLSELKYGDIITELDGTPVPKLLESWGPYYAASNGSARMLAVGRFMTRGECGEAEIGIRRESQELKLKVKRVAPEKGATWVMTHDSPGPTFRLLSKDVAYLKLSSVKASEAPHYVESAAGTKGLIIDIRNYPSEFMVFALGSLLVDSETPFVRFTQGDLANPGAFHWGKPLSLSPAKPHYGGIVVILDDETSMSQAEYTTMAFRSARGAIVVGSQTAGADGNVSAVPLPGGLQTMISGIGVFYPDKIPTQRIGIVPNVEVHPTIAGIRAHRDEVLEEALRQILGPQVPQSEIQKMASPDAVAR
jgi:C-terminal processing protease CtpA/Prc